jgi:CheY-like chemotaxis protein
MAEDESPRSRRTLRRALLAAGRAAALIAIVTGVNGLIAPNQPVWGYAVAVFLGGIASGLLTALIAGVLALIGMVAFFSAPGALGWLSVAIAAIAGGVIGHARRQRVAQGVSVPPQDISKLAAEVRQVEAAREDDRTRAASEMSDALETIRQLHDELNEARTALVELQREHTNLQEQHREQKTAGGELLGRADTLVADLTAELAAARAAAENETKLREQYESEHENLEMAASRALEDVQGTRATNDELRSALDDARARLAKVTATYEQVTVELATEREHARAAAARVHELQQSHGRADGVRSQLERVNDELHRKFETEVQRVQRESNEKLAQLDRQWGEKLQKIVTELASDHEDDLGEAVAAREQARAEVRSLNSRVQELQHQLEAARTRPAVDEKALRGQIDAEWGARLQKIVNELVADQENAIGEAVEQREKARAEARSLGIRVQELEKSRAELKRQTQERPLPPPEIDRQQIDAEWSAKLQKVVNELAADHETDIGTAIEAREAARAEARSLSVRVQELEKSRAELKRQTQERPLPQETAIAAAIEARDAARAEARDLNIRLTSLQNSMENELRRLHAERNSLLLHVQGLEQEIVALRLRPAVEPAPAVEEELPFGPLVSLPDSPPLESEEERRARAEVLQFAEQANAALRRASTPEPQPADEHKPLIILVHHDPALRNLYRDRLLGSGFRVMTAADGLEGMRLATKHKPDVVIADAVMPKMDGHELCQLIKSNAETASAKVVLMTGVYTNEVPRVTAEQAFEPDELMRKPVKFDALKNVLTNLLAAKTA